MASADRSTRAGGRVLVVEDEYLIAEHIASMLRDLGYDVVGPVPTIAEALEAIAAETLDGVLLDANLGGTSSAPIAAELAARRVPFVVVTGYGNLELPSTALQAAPRVNKPFTAADLGAILARTVAP